MDPTYDPITGYFTRNGKRAGSSDCTKGYRKIMYRGKQYKEHRLAWYLSYGYWPLNQIDHINSIKDDNRLSNLRDVSQTINMYNKQKAHRQNNTNILGVAKSGSKFQARIRVDNRLVYLGTYETAELAGEAYCNYKRTLVGL